MDRRRSRTGSASARAHRRAVRGESALNPPRSLAHTPLLQVMFTWANSEEGELALPGLQVSPIRTSYTAAKFDLTLSLTEVGGRISGGLDFATALFDRATAEQGKSAEALAQFEKACEITASAVRGTMGSQTSQPASFVGDVFREVHKALHETAEGMVILAQVLRQQGDDEAWYRAADGLASDVQALRTAAGGESSDACKELRGSLCFYRASIKNPRAVRTIPHGLQFRCEILEFLSCWCRGFPLTVDMLLDPQFDQASRQGMQVVFHRRLGRATSSRFWAFRCRSNRL
jgi:hypothetical protein